MKEDALKPIGFKAEFENIQTNLAGYGIKYYYQLATIQNLIDVLAKNPIGLHLSCHGLINERNTFINLMDNVNMIN